MPDGVSKAIYCDDGNLDEYDGCTSDCVVSFGWDCSGGTDTLPDSCIEICGDGYNLGLIDCDDGN